MTDYNEYQAEQQRQMEVSRIRQQKEAEQEQRDAQARSAGIEIDKYLKRNPMPTPTPEPAMPPPDLTPDRQGRLSSKQLVEQALYREFERTLIRRYRSAGTPSNFNDPVERAKVRKIIAQSHPEQLAAYDRAEALLAGGPPSRDKLETGDSPINGFISSQRGGPAPEDSLYHCTMENCDFNINRHLQSGRLAGVSISNHRILIVFQIKSSLSFTPYSLSWDDIQSARLEEGVSDKAALTIITKNQNGRTATYLLQGPREDLAVIEELINLYLKTAEEELEKEARRASLHPVMRGLLTAFERLTNS